MVLSPRKKKILGIVVESYVKNAEPVGSKAVAALCGVSSATIRNEMADLEEAGLLTHPHTSAGRIPTSKGYRVYVNEIMARHSLTERDTSEINSLLSSKARNLNKILENAGEITAKLTNYPVYTMATVSKEVTISRFDLIYVSKSKFIIVLLLSDDSVHNKLISSRIFVGPNTLKKLATVFNTRFTGLKEKEITSALIESAERSVGDETGVVAVIAGFAIETLVNKKMMSTSLTGTSHLFNQPEYQDVDKAKRIINYLSDDSEILKLPAPDASGCTRITIGNENDAEELKDSSIVVARYNAGNNLEGIIGIVGPTRMDYPQVAARLSYIAQGLSWLLSGGFMLPEGTGNDNNNNNE